LRYAVPVEGELSRQEINWLFDLIAGHLKAHALCRKGFIEPFLRIIDSELIVYGVHDGSPFTRQFETDELLHSFVDVFQQGASSGVRKTRSSPNQSRFPTVEAEQSTHEPPMPSTGSALTPKL
jgi:hypothetical protein